MSTPVNLRIHPPPLTFINLFLFQGGPFYPLRNYVCNTK